MNNRPTTDAGTLVSIMLIAACICALSTWGGAAIAVWKAAIWSDVAVLQQNLERHQ